MKWTMHYSRAALLGLILTGALIFNGCKEDDPLPVTTISFANSNQVIGEQAGEQTVNILFDRPAAIATTFVVTFTSSDAVYGEDFTTTPSSNSGTISITVAKGQSAAQVKVTPINNALLDGDKTIDFSLSEPGKGIEIGSGIELSLSITDDEAPVQANFALGTSAVVEATSAGTDVIINLSAAAPGTGELTVNLTSANATYGTHFTTIPAAANNSIKLPVAVGQTNLTIKVVPVDNLDINTSRQITLTLGSFTSNAVTIGTLLNNHIFTINDDETASLASFATSTGSVSEGDANGITVSLTLSPAATAAGSVKIGLTSENAVYGTNYTTDPAAVEGVVTVPVAQGQTAVSFKVIPINDSEEKANRAIQLTISGGTGIITPASSGTTYALTISEDDIAATIAFVRSLFQGTATTITNDIFIRGVVTSTNDNLTARNLFIQDASGAIQLRLVSNNTFVRGDEIKVQLKDASLGLNSGLLQIGGSSGIPNANVTKVGTGTLPSYQTVTLAELNAGGYESRLIKISGVGFFDANDVNNFRYDGGLGAGNNKIGDASGNSAVMRVESTSTAPNSPFAAALIPAGTGTIQGIATVFNGVWQISPQASGDIFSGSETAIISPNQTTLSFGEVNNGASTTQTYQLTGTSLIGGVIIKAPASYTVSSDGTTFASEITLLAGTANAGPVTVTVKFSPTSGVNQAISGKLTHKSVSAKVKEIDLTGNEVGNGTASTLLLNEQFDYQAGQLTAVNAGANVSGGKWVNYSGTTLPLTVTSGSLTYAGYLGSTGNKVSMVNGSAEDAYTAFTTVNTGKIYVAFLVNVTSATGLAVNSSATGDYFAGFLPSNSTSNFAGRISIKAGVATSTYNLGFRATGVTGQTAEFLATDFALNTTQLVVMSYEFVSGTANDIVKFWINPTVSTTEPAATFTQTSAGDSPDLTRFYLRQGTNAVNADIDGIRVALKWEDLFPSN